MRLMKKIETMYPQNCIIKSNNTFFSKKKFNWTSTNIKWFLDAEETTDFYEKAIEEMQLYIDNSNTAIDIGCGIGTFSIELARKGLKVTSVDISSVVIEALNKRIDKSYMQNIDAFNTAFEFISDKESYDVVLMSYMMGLVNDNNIEKILNLSNKYVVLILPVDEIKDDFSITELYQRIGIDTKELKQHTYEKLLETFNKLKIRYNLKLFQSEFGQPFDSKEEAVNFIQYYFNIPVIKKIQILEWINEKLIEKDNKYYLANKKRSAMILIKK